MQRWRLFLHAWAGTTARRLPTSSPAWSEHVCPLATTAALWLVSFHFSFYNYFIYLIFLLDMLLWLKCLHKHHFAPLIQIVCERSDVFASACAIARAFPLFTRRSASSRRKEKKHVTVEFITVGQENSPLEVSTLEVRSQNSSKALYMTLMYT